MWLFLSTWTRTSLWPNVAFLVTHIRLFLATIKSLIVSLFIVHTSFCFSFPSHFSNTYLLILVAPAASRCLGSYQEPVAPLDASGKSRNQ